MVCGACSRKKECKQVVLHFRTHDPISSGNLQKKIVFKREQQKMNIIQKERKWKTAYCLLDFSFYISFLPTRQEYTFTRLLCLVTLRISCKTDRAQIAPTSLFLFLCFLCTLCELVFLVLTFLFSSKLEDTLSLKLS